MVWRGSGAWSHAPGRSASCAADEPDKSHKPDQSDEADESDHSDKPDEAGKSDAEPGEPDTVTVTERRDSDAPDESHQPGQ